MVALDKWVNFLAFLLTWNISSSSTPAGSEDVLKALDNSKYATVPAHITGVNNLDKDGLTPVMIAASVGQLDPLRNYIDAGADINLLTAEKNTALMLSIKGGFYYTSVELIKAGSKLDHANKYGITPLLLAIVGGHSAIAVALLDGGANPDIAHPDGSTALIMAAQSGSISLVKRLLQKGAAMNLQAKSGDTALMFACATGHLDIVKYLLERGADSRIKNIRGYTALIFAAVRGQGKIIDVLLNHNPVLLEVKDRLGRSALNHAIESSQQTAVDYLVALGAELPQSGYRVSAEVMQRRKEHLEKIQKEREPKMAS